MKLNLIKIRSVLTKKAFMLPLIAISAGIISFMGTQAITSADTPTVDCKGVCVSLQNDRMSPDELAVKVGSYVQFNAADGLKHNISLGDGASKHEAHADKDHHDHESEYSSGDFSDGEAWRVQFKKAGTYKLHDHYNPHQRILVVVY